MNSKFWLGVLVVVLGVAAGWYVLKGPENQLPNLGGSFFGSSPTPTFTVDEGGQMNWGNFNDPNRAPTSAPGQKTENLGKGGASERVVVTYTDSGFGPSLTTVVKGTTVAFINESSGGMWVASAVHPTHQLLPGFDQLKSVLRGGNYEYTFTKVGTWTYHNHVKPEVTGKVMVTE